MYPSDLDFPTGTRWAWNGRDRGCYLWNPWVAAAGTAGTRSTHYELCKPGVTFFTTAI